MNAASAVLIYDGQCPRCTAFARFAKAWSGEGLRLVTLDSPGAADLHPDLSYPRMLSAAHLVLPNGYLAAGAEAGALALGLRPGWAWFFQLYYFPVVKQFCNACYWLIKATRRKCAACGD